MTKHANPTTDQSIQYEFEVERETRYVIEPLDEREFDWQNHVVDTYDASGRARIRVKNGKPRLSLKVPLFSKDTATAKTCLRLEFKPKTPTQERDLLHIRDLILEEAGTQTAEKWGARLATGSGGVVWINRDNADNWWIEVDEDVDFELPAGVTILGTTKSSIQIK